MFKTFSVAAMVTIGLSFGLQAKAQTSYYPMGDVAISPNIKVNAPASSVDENQVWFYDALGQVHCPAQLTYPAPNNVGRLWSYSTGVNSVMLRSGNRQAKITVLYPTYAQRRYADGTSSAWVYLAPGIYTMTFDNVTGWQWFLFYFPGDPNRSTYVQYIQ